MKRLMEDFSGNFTFHNCRPLFSGNNSFISPLRGFRGLPENFLINFSCFLAILAIFFVLKHIAWKEYKNSITKSNYHRTGWIELLYTDVFDYISPIELIRYDSDHSPLDKDMPFYRMLIHSFFGISDEQVLRKCGENSCQYLIFLKYTTHFLIVNAIVCLCCILPTNVQGNEEPEERTFERTTITNLNVYSRLIWIHIAASSFLVVACWIAVRAIFLNLRMFRKGRWATRTIFIKGIEKESLSSEAIESHFKEFHSKCTIEDIKLVYKYRKLLHLDKSLKFAKNNLQICENIKQCESREVMVSNCRWFFHNLVSCQKCQINMINGCHYYRSKVNVYKEAIAQELNRLPKRILPFAFITFHQEEYAQQMLSTSIRFSSLKVNKNWRITQAAEPSNIYWENIREGTIIWNFRTFFINSLVFLIAFFLTTPAIVLSSFKLNLVKSAPTNIFVSKFFLSVLVWILSASIPALVAYSSHYLEFETKSQMYKSLMKKTVIFLILTVVVLPSLGFTSLNALIQYALTRITDFGRWNCIFLPDNGAFIIDYVMTSTFIGITIQLLRIPDVLYCFYSVLMARSEAEIIAIRKDFSPWDFSFGVQYSYALLIFSLTVFFSILSPIMSIFGLIYFLLKSLVDRYNIYFTCAPSQISHNIHILAVKFLMLAIMLKVTGIFFLLYIRSGWKNTATFAASCVMWITLVISLTTMNPCGWKFLPPCTVLPMKQLFKPYRRGNFTQSGEEDVFQPRTLQKYIPIIPKLDKYKNPIPLEDAEKKLTYKEINSERLIFDSKTQTNNEK